MRTLVIGPHADDELFGCGGTLLRRRSEGHVVGWILMTDLSIDDGFSEQNIIKRKEQIDIVRSRLGINESNFFNLNYRPAYLDVEPLGNLVERLSNVVREFQPNEVLVPYFGDVHSDHRVTFEAASTSVKSFRHPYVERVLAYETVSETDFGINPAFNNFKPNFFVNINSELSTKLELLSNYESEILPAPFPRSLENVQALARFRGSQSGFLHAEAYMSLIQRIN